MPVVKTVLKIAIDHHSFLHLRGTQYVYLSEQSSSGEKVRAHYCFLVPYTSSPNAMFIHILSLLEKI